MISLNYTMNGATVIPDRELTDEEKSKVTSVLTHGGDLTITYYQGDEPVVDVLTDEETMEFWDERGLETKQYIQVRNIIWSILVTKSGGVLLPDYDSITNSEKKIAAKWILSGYNQRTAMDIFTDEQDIIHFTICIEQTAGIFKNDLEGRSRIIEEMRQFVAINYFRRELMTKLQADDFYDTCALMLGAFEKTNNINFRYWLQNEVGTVYENTGFQQKEYYDVAIKNRLIDILNGNY